MSCTRYQFELSQCLDGRLSNARQREVMAHANNCARCSLAWEEMQEAQSLIFRLEQPEVTTGFREAVWERVQSGEGTPEVLLNERISFAAKCRYGLVGAAAAALFLLTYNLWFTPSIAPIPPEENLASKESEFAEDHSSSGVIAGTQEVNGGFLTEPLTAATLANHTIGEVSGAASRLKLRRKTVLTNPAKTPGGVWVDIRNDVQVLGDGLQFLGSLEKEDFVEFQGRSRQCMEQARIALVAPSEDRRSIQVLVQTLSSCPLDGLESGLRFHARATHFDERLLRLIQGDRERINRMFSNMQLMPQALPQAFGNQQQQQFQFFIIRNDGSGVQTLEGLKRPGSRIQLLTTPPGQDDPNSLKRRARNQALRSTQGRRELP
ncbi:MAG: hypothetical protein VX951_00250 [Planctomycetota bacterium]|nr:hypothetical protein [Planctomycetota bacterium]